MTSNTKILFWSFMVLISASALAGFGVAHAALTFSSTTIVSDSNVILNASGNGTFQVNPQAGSLGGLYVASSGYIGNNPNPVAPIDFSNNNITFNGPQQILFADTLVQGTGLTDISSFATATINSGVLVGGGPTYRCNSCRWTAGSAGSDGATAITLDFGSAYGIMGVTFGSWTRQGCTLGGVAIDGSNDNSTWTNLGNPVYNCHQIALFGHGGFNNSWLGGGSTAYRYLRISYTVSGVSPQMAGLQVFTDAGAALWGNDIWGPADGAASTMWRGIQAGNVQGNNAGVLIGSQLVESRLTVGNQGAGGMNIASFQNLQAAANNNGAQILFDANRTTSGMTNVAAISGIITDVTQNAYKGALAFYTANNAAATSSEKMRIDYLGNVGIGTTTPATWLQVAATPSSTIRIGSGILPGCLEMGNSDGSAGLNYVTVLNGVISATTTKPANCQ